jgi:hypothetical protein
MKRRTLLLALGAGIISAVAAAAFVGSIGPRDATASSHREAPLIADDPAADNTDVYAFVSPDKPNTVTIIANYIPFEDPAGGPNYYRFDPTVLYALNVDNNGDGKEDVAYQFRFKTQVKNPNTFLYNTGPIDTIANQDTNLSVKQTYTVTRVTTSGSTVLGANLRVPPTNIGPRSNPTYDAFQGVESLGSDRMVFAGPRDDPFFVDLGSIFDLGGLRPFNSLHAIALGNDVGKDGVKNYNTHTIAIQVPKTDLLKAPLANGTIGIYASASRPKVTILRGDGTFDANGPQVQVSRLGNPLINEVVIPLGKKDYWNASDPSKDSQFVDRYLNPELAALEGGLYPILDGPPTTGRGDLAAILLTGVPTLNFTGATQADLLRLNTNFTAPPVGTGNRLGLLGGEFSGFPNGRRLEDDVTDIEIRAVACGYGMVVGPIIESFGFCNGNANRTPNSVIGDGVDTNADNPFLSAFPYVAAPNQGYAHTGHR